MREDQAIAREHSRLSRLVGSEFAEIVLAEDPDLAPHALMAGAAEFLTWHQVIARFVERRLNNGYEARDQHHVDVGALDQKAVHDIGAGGAEGHRRAGGYGDAGWREGILLAEGADSDRAVRIDGSAEIAFDELAGEMQGAEVNRFDSCLGHRQLMNAGERSEHDHQAHDADRDDGPAPLELFRVVRAIRSGGRR